MEARAAREGEGRAGARIPTWLLGLVPLALIAGAAIAFGVLGAPGLGDRTGPPVEDVTVERTVLRPGEIEMTLRNDGPDPVAIEQVAISDSYVPFATSDQEIGRLESATLTMTYPWIEGGLMALLGVYVGVIPVAMGMLWLPFVRRIDPGWIRFLLAFTIGLLVFLGVDATLEGLEIAGEGPQAFGGAALVFLGALSAFLALAAVDGWLAKRRKSAGSGAAAGAYLALLVAIGIGLHNLGEGLAIGSAYAGGALALGAFLVVGFALHNTTEGLAIVAPMASARPRLGRLVLLGLIAGAPAILGAWVGAAAFNSSVVAFMLGVGAGAIAQVVVAILPSVRDESGRALDHLTALGMLAGVAALYLTSLLVSV